MDILIAIFIFIIAFVITIIGVPKKGDTIKSKTLFFMVVGGMVFIILGVMILSDPIDTITGLSTVENDTTANVTSITTEFVFTDIDSDFNTLFGIMFSLIGVFIMFFGVMVR